MDDIHFALYAHWAVDNEPSDAELGKTKFWVNLHQLDAVQRIASRTDALINLLCPDKGCQGVLFLFFDPSSGWTTTRSCRLTT